MKKALSFVFVIAMLVLTTVTAFANSVETFDWNKLSQETGIGAEELQATYALYGEE